jgi:uncharacterized protein YcbK (DUF882 family)
MRARVVAIFIAVVSAAIVLLSAQPLKSAVNRASPFKYTGDGTISIVDVQTGERVNVVYKDEKGRYNDSALEAIDHTLRCHGSGREIPISLKLVEFIDHVQDHFGAETVKVVSGYRSQEYNAKLKRRLKRVARESMHIHGLAMDIKIPGVDKRQLAEYAMDLGAGGVGVYRSSTFVHLDVGPVRHW